MTFPAQDQLPPDRFLGQSSPTSTRSRSLLGWRDWSLSTKLAATLLVPLLLAAVLGVVTVSNRIAQAADHRRIDHLVALNSSLQRTLDALAQERTNTAALLTQGVVGTSPELDQARRDADAAANSLTQALDSVSEDGGVVSTNGSQAKTQLARLTALRGQVAASQLDTVQAVNEYSTITNALIRVATAANAALPESPFGGTPAAQSALLSARDSLSQVQALGSYGLARASLAPSELTMLRTAVIAAGNRFDDFHAMATTEQNQDFDATVSAPYTAFTAMVKTMVEGQNGQGRNSLRDISSQQWLASAHSTIDQLGRLSDRLAALTQSTAHDLVSGTGTGLAVLIAIIALILLLAVVLGVLLIRQILRSLKVLRVSARGIAEVHLPLAVRNIQEGKPQSAEIVPIPVASQDQIGEVAKAFDAVHAQAVKLAVEQEAVRAGYGSVFVNLSRRSQSLVQRQLQLIERLERDEEDADQLATLFQLDHLATRMRRNNENLMLLSGAEPSRRFGQPVSTSDVLGAAISEIEQYQRVTVQTPPSARVVGYAASDLMRLLAELLDNATSFSAPETQVTLAAQLTEQGALVIDILDKGIGMNEAEVAEANLRLGEVGSLDLATSRRMGLFVVGRLAARHGIGVTLHGGKDIVGVRATVTVAPALVITSSSTPTVERVFPAGAPAALPRRQRAKGNTPQNSVAAQQKTPADSPQQPSPLEASGTALFTPISSDAQPSGDGAVNGKPIVDSGSDSDREADVAVEESSSGQNSRQRSELPSGKALFESTTPHDSVISDWWSSEVGENGDPAAQPGDVPAVAMGAEHTPIFDEMVSVWFRSLEPETTAKQDHTDDASLADQLKDGGPEPDDAAVSTQDQPVEAADWDSANDERWRTVREVSQAEPVSFTDAGLPVRQRGEQLLPGSVLPATSIEAQPTPVPNRDPVDIRGRLSSFQKGVHRGRKSKHAADVDTAADSQTTDSPSELIDSPPVRDPQPVQNPPSSDWSFAADENLRAARTTVMHSTVDSDLADVTGAGLPKRRRGEQLLPGNVTSMGSGATASPVRPARDPQDVRGRLSSFQRGVRRGRHQAEPVTEAETQSEKSGQDTKAMTAESSAPPEKEGSL